MDLQQAKSLINKINALFKGIESGDNMLSAIERDLMLSYIRQLYEEFLNVRADMPAAKSPTRSTEGESAQPDFEVIAPKEPPQKASKPKIIEIPDSLKDLEPAPPPPPKPKIVKEEAPPPKKEPEPQRQPAQQPKPDQSNKRPDPEQEQEYTVLFEHKAAKELSEKLSERRIDDLANALAINDRLLYMNDRRGQRHAEHALHPRAGGQQGRQHAQRNPEALE